MVSENPDKLKNAHSASLDSLGRARFDKAFNPIKQYSNYSLTLDLANLLGRIVYIILR